MKVKYLFLTVCSIFLLGSSMTAYAQPKTMPDGTVFDAEYYANTYPDVKAAYGNNEKALYNHYVKFGKAEGRKATATTSNATTKTDFDPVFYANTYPDVKAAFGNDEKALYNHYIKYGKAEGRLGVAPQNATQSSPAKTDGSIKAQVNALGITYDPSRDARLYSQGYVLHPVSDNWHEFKFEETETGLVSKEAQEWNKSVQGFTRADYTNDPLYLALAKDLVSARSKCLKVYNSGNANVSNMADANVLTYLGSVGDIVIDNMDREYLLNVTSNLSLDYMESMLGYDLGWIQPNSVIDFSCLLPDTYKQFFHCKMKIIMLAEPSGTGIY